MIRILLLLTDYEEAFLKAGVHAVCSSVVMYCRCGIYHFKSSSARVVNVIIPLSQIVNLDFDTVVFSFGS